MVSPPSKNGGDAFADSARTHVATDGNAVAFTSLAAFGDVAGTGIATEYLAERSIAPNPNTNGWATHAITPPQQPLSFFAGALGLDPIYAGDFSSDLSHGIFRAWSLLSNAPNVSSVENLYLRTDLRSAGTGSYQLLTNAIAPVGSSVNPFLNALIPALAGASEDFKQVLFESRYQLTSDATGSGPWLYEWERGTLSVAGVLPDGTVLSGAMAGRGALQSRYTPHVISADGLKLFFTDPSTGVNGTDGALYMRETDPVTTARTTIQVNTSERTDCADHNPCNGTPEPDPNGQPPATYWDASLNGDRMFFTTQEALTDEAPVNGDVKLYMYDTSKPATDPHNLSFLSPDHQPADPAVVDGVIGASDDGHYVYFTAAGQLVANAPVLGGHGIYLWHDGVVSYAGELEHPSEDLLLDLPDLWILNAAESRVTSDGKHLLFMSSSGAGLTGADHGSCPGNASGQCHEVYVYSAQSGQTLCASCIPSGAPASVDAHVQVRADAGPVVTSFSQSHAISDDGRHVFFSTAEALVPQDTNHLTDAYEYDVLSDTVHLLSTGKDPSDSYFLNASPSGNDTFILTRQQLVGWDKDNAYDLYDVRVGGGFPDPKPAPQPCSGDACQGSPILPPAFDTPPSVTVSGQGNLKPVVSKKVSKSSSNSQKLRKALKACKSRHKKAKRGKCEATARRRFGKSGGSK